MREPAPLEDFGQVAPPSAARRREVALAGADDHRLLAPEVAHGHPAAPDLGERAVAAVDRLPDGAAHGRRAVPAARPEAPPRVRAQAPDRAPRSAAAAPSRRPGRAASPEAEPFSRSSVSPLALGRRDCRTWKIPLENRPSWRPPRRFFALWRLTLPRFVSRNEPTGIWRASRSGLNRTPFWLAVAPARSAAPRGAQRTFPIGSTFTSRPRTGAGRSVSRIAIWNSNVAGVGSTLPAASRARTWNV